MNSNSAELFLPDIFSSSGPKWYEAFRDKAADVIHLLDTHYSVAQNEVVSIQQSNAVELNSNNYLVHTINRKIVVKRWPMTEAHDKSDLETQACLANWLAKQDICVPIIHPSSETGTFVVSYMECYWCVMSYVEGSYFSGGGCELQQAGNELCSLFRALGRVPQKLLVAKTIHPLGRNLIDAATHLDKNRGEWSNILGGTYASILNESWHDIKSDLEMLLATKLTLTMKLSLCHIDLHPHNVLMIGCKTAAILDYHSLVMAPHESIVAFNLFKLARQTIVENGGNHSNENFRAQLELVIGYLEQNEVIADKLRDRLSIFAKMEIMRRLLLIVELNIGEKNQDWNHVLPIQIRALKEADLVFL